MSLCPPVVIDVFDYTPLKFGLKSVAKPFPGTVDPHWQSCGVQWLSYTCAEGSTWIDDCESIGIKAVPPEPTLLEFDPVTAYADWLCGPIGSTPEERQAKSELALNCVEERLLEEHFYTSFLTGGSAVALNTVATAVSLPAGVGYLEGALGAVQCGEPTIHAPRELGAVAGAYHLTYGSGSMLKTPLGSSWIFGSGYPDTDPDGVPAADTISWIYGTGPMYLIQGPASMNPPSFADALNRTNNEVRWEANRTSLVATNSCAVFAVAVVVGATGGGGGGGGGTLFPAP